MYAIDPSRKDEIVAMLRDTGFDPARDSRSYPGDPEQVEARAALRRMVAEAREASIDPKDRGAAMIPAEQLIAIPGTTKSKASKDKASAKARTDPAQVKETIDKAMAQANDIEMVYRARNGEALTVLVQPQRLAFKAEAPVLVGLDRKEDARRTYLLERIEQLKIVAAP